MIVGLTGTIGAGKSTVAAVMEKRGAVVIESRDLATDAQELFTAIHTRVERGRLENSTDRLVEPEAATRPTEE